MLRQVTFTSRRSPLAVGGAVGLSAVTRSTICIDSTLGTLAASGCAGVECYSSRVILAIDRPAQRRSMPDGIGVPAPTDRRRLACEIALIAAQAIERFTPR